MSMKKPTTLPLAKTAILTLAEIKAAIEAFERGDANVMHTLVAIQIAVEAYRIETSSKSRRPERHPRAA